VGVDGVDGNGGIGVLGVSGGGRVALLDPLNPVAVALREGRPFHYFHTHAVTHPLLRAAERQAKSIDFDIYRDIRGGLHNPPLIQHPPAYYSHLGLPLPDNLPLLEAMRVFEAEAHRDTVLVLDAKSKGALGVIQQMVQKLGSHRVIVHGFAAQLSFTPPPRGVEPQPHWKEEDIAVQDLVAAASPPGARHRAAVMVTCRHVTPARLHSPQWGVMSRLERVAHKRHGVDVVGFWLPGGKAPPCSFAEELLARQQLVSFNLDAEHAACCGNQSQEGVWGAAEACGEAIAFPAPYVGMTDLLHRATINARRTHKL